MDERRTIFNALLTALWLRPESALWYSHMLAAARTYSAHVLPGPTLDFGCMDGLNTYVLMGGQPPEDFDVFDEVAADAGAHRRSTLRDDYYDRIVQGTDWNLPPPPGRFDIGIDWKAAHVEKASRVGVHGKIHQWQPGTPMDMVATASIGGIWAPNIYWMENVGAILAEFARIVRPGGRIVTIGPDAALPAHMLFAQRESYDESWLADLDRGRFVNATRNGRSLADWDELFGAAGLSIVRQDRFIPTALNAVYEVGFRPMFVPLVEMRRQLLALGRDDMMAVKRPWMARLKTLLDPFLDDQVLSGLGEQRLWHIFELTPRGSN